MRFTVVTVALAVVVVAGCGGSGNSTTDSISATAPTFLSFGTNVMSLDKGETLIVSAVLTSPMGNDLVGGTLMDDTGAIQYGAFQSGTEKGSFSLSQSWDQINVTKPLTFTSSDQRTFVAKFFAANGESASKTFTISFTCQGVSACSGDCKNLTNDESNCGTCGTGCQFNPTSGVTLRGCETSVCAYGVSSSTKMACSAVCTSKGLTCTNSCTGMTDANQPVTFAMAYYVTGTGNIYSTSCSEVPPSGGSNEYCCCD